MIRQDMSSPAPRHGLPDTLPIAFMGPVRAAGLLVAAAETIRSEHTQMLLQDRALSAEAKRRTVDLIGDAIDLLNKRLGKISLSPPPAGSMKLMETQRLCHEAAQHLCCWIETLDDQARTRAIAAIGLALGTAKDLHCG